MPNPQDLSAAFSFIAPFLADSALCQYGDNALPLYAVALHLEIEDIHSFAAASLTDHPSDKKADIIYIDEADGLACVAQGFVAKEWGKPSAKANKASDLNTAAAWLLQTPIDDVPPAIQGHARLLRDSLSRRTITRLVFAYAHNANESQNVQNELDAVCHLVTSLPAVNGATVEVIELGLKRIEDLFLASSGSIHVKEEVILPAKGAIFCTGDKWSAYILPISGLKLHDLYEDHGNALFSANLRDFLGARKSARNVNGGIKNTVENDGNKFFVLNNGITIVTKKAVFDKAADTLHVFGVSVVNGAQTTGCLHAAGAENAAHVSVLARVIVVEREEMISELVTANNTQNSFVAWDRRSNDPIQVRIHQAFERLGLNYVHRRANLKNSSSSIFAEQVGQMLCSFGGDLQTAIREKGNIFEVDSFYRDVFPTTISIGHIYAVQSLGWAFDSVKQALKQKLSKTQRELSQERLIEYPASKQFVVHVVGALREEIAGFRIQSPKELAFKEEFILPHSMAAVGAWTEVLQALLPLMANRLPAAEYEVVRSSEHAKTVAETVGGIVAGLSSYGDSFSTLRSKLLQPE